MAEMDSPRGTTAHSPDLGWSQVCETVLMLELSAAQIEAAMRESNGSVDVLTASFTNMAETLRAITDTLNAAAATDDAATRGRLLSAAGEVSGMVNQAVVAFQFYDKLAQRLGHVTHSLGDLATLVADQRRIYNPQEWVELQGRIRAKYTTADERAMFEAVMAGTPVGEAIAHYVDAMKHKPADDIELF